MFKPSYLGPVDYVFCVASDGAWKRDVASHVPLLWRQKGGTLTFIHTFSFLGQ